MAFSVLDLDSFPSNVVLALVFVSIACPVRLGAIKDSKDQAWASDTMSKKFVQDVDRFRNFSTARSCLRLNIKDSRSEKHFQIVVGNIDFADFVAEEKGIRPGKTSQDRDKYEKFLKNEYVKFMLENRGKVLTIDLETLRKRATVLTVDQSMTFAQLGVKNEPELLEQYFDIDVSTGSGTLKSQYYSIYTRNAGFIGLLLDLGYDVVWGDLLPNLSIHTRPFISSSARP